MDYYIIHYFDYIIPYFYTMLSLKVINSKDAKKGEKERMSTFYTRDKKKTNI